MLRCSDDGDLSCYAPMCLDHSSQPPPSCCYSMTRSCVPEASGLGEPGVPPELGSWMTNPSNENCASTRFWEPGGDVSSLGLPLLGGFSGFEPGAEFEHSMLLSAEAPAVPYVEDLQGLGFLPRMPAPLELGLPSVNELGLFSNDELCKGLNAGDAGFSFENSEPILSFPQDNLGYTTLDGGVNGLFMENFEVTNLNGHVGSTVEASSSGQHDQMPCYFSHVVGPASTLQAVNSNGDQVANPNSYNNIKLGFPNGTVCQNTCLGESNVSDYQGNGVSPLFHRSESPWDSNLESIHLQARTEAKIRYNEKKRRRSFGKQVRYASRKVRADTRKRMKGRFVKAGDTSDSFLV